MKRTALAAISTSILALIALPGCAEMTGQSGVELQAAGPPVDYDDPRIPSMYVMPSTLVDGDVRGSGGQAWSMLGREDRTAAANGREYLPQECEPLAGGSSGFDAMIDAIVARAEDHRIVIINESHQLTRHRQTTLRLLEKLRPLGFTVFAAEAFSNSSDGVPPVEEAPGVEWPRQIEGFYVREPIFGRLVRQAKALGYRLAAYEELFDPEANYNDPAEAAMLREESQARQLAGILASMGPEEHLLIHAGYGHASESPIMIEGQQVDMMAGRLKAVTGIDPLTISQTDCRHAEGPLHFAQRMDGTRTGGFDLLLSHPTELFADRRPVWRREGGDVPIPIPASLRPTEEPLVIEAFAEGEPFDAVPVDRVLVEPGEEIPLLLPPGRYCVRAVRLASN